MGLKHVLTHTPPEVELSEYLPKASELFKARQAVAAEATSAAGAEAVAAAAAEDGAEQTASGLVIKTLAAGEGDSPSAKDKVRVHYEGRLTDGTVFDSSYKRGEPIEFALSGVVPGWTEGLQLMKPGGKAKLTFSSELGYGDAGQGPIPPKACLIFDVELLAVL